MRILYLCHRVPYPPNKGDKIRAFHQLQAMSARHEVDLFTLADDTEDLAHQSELKRYCHDVTVARLNPKLARLRALPHLLTRTPLTIPYFYSAELAAAIRKAAGRQTYDRIFVFCSAMAQYTEATRGIPVVTDLVDVDSDKWAQYAAFARFPLSVIYRREARCLRECEKSICAKSSCVLVTTEREERLVREISGATHIQVVPNGVDTEYFQPPIHPPDPAAPAIVFTGDMSYFPNQEAVVYFAQRVLPLIQRSNPKTRFLVVGRNPAPKVQGLRKIEGVEVTGFVPDIRTYLTTSTVAVAPFSIAAGIQNKILEAMACGLPVVATPRAVQGLTPGVAKLVGTGNTPEELAERVLEVINNKQLAREKGMEGRCRVMADYSWDRSADYLLQLLENPVSEVQATAAVPSPLS